MLGAFYFINLFFIKISNQPYKFAIAELVGAQSVIWCDFKKNCWPFFFIIVESTRTGTVQFTTQKISFILI
jgi:hypothetical protein